MRPREITRSIAKGKKTQINLDCSEDTTDTSEMDHDRERKGARR